MSKQKFVIIVGAVILFSLVAIISFSRRQQQPFLKPTLNTDEQNDQGGMLDSAPHQLSIEYLRQGDYPGSDIVIEQTLSPGSNYQRYIASYKSEGLKIYALLTIPNGNKPQSGWPTIVFNHGYIPPTEYRTTERYIAYTDGFSRNGYIVFRPDYRGHGNSEGEPSGAYGSNGYTIDVLNAVSSIKKLKDANPEKIGMWGHSLGGFITLRSMVTTKDIKAGVIWAGVVASYSDLFNNWRRRNTSPPPGIPSRALSWRNQLTAQYGTPEENTNFWNSISANSYLADISGPLQLHHGTGDSSVPVMFSEKLDQQLKQTKKTSELFTYPTTTITYPIILIWQCNVRLSFLINILNNHFSYFSA